MADNHTIARPYARAAFELASESAGLAAWAESLGTAKELLADRRIGKVVTNPTLTDEQKTSFLSELFLSAGGESSIFAGRNEQGTNFLRLLIEYGRVTVLPEIADRFNALKDNVENTIDVTVRSAAALTSAQQSTIVSSLKKRLGREINLHTELDESLIGGAVIRAGDVVIDGSLRSRLESLATVLIS